MKKTTSPIVIDKQYYAMNRKVGIKIGKTTYSIPICVEEQIFDNPTLICKICNSSCKISTNPEECTLMSGLTVSRVYHEIEVEVNAGVFIGAESGVGKKLLKKIQSVFKKMGCVCDDCRYVWEDEFEHVDVIGEIL